MPGVEVVINFQILHPLQKKYFLNFLFRIWNSTKFVGINIFDKGLKSIESKVFDIGNDVTDILTDLGRIDSFITEAYPTCAFAPYLNSEKQPNDSEWVNPDLLQLNPDLSQFNPDLSQLNPNLLQLNPPVTT